MFAVGRALMRAAIHDAKTAGINPRPTEQNKDSSVATLPLNEKQEL